VSTETVSYPAAPAARPRPRALAKLRLERLLAFPELLGLLAVAGVLNLWGLSINGYANTYYSAAVRSMAASWHNFLFASMDPSGLMTVDKPPLSLWVQALSVRVFGFHPLSMLVPQALMGMVAVGLVYDLVRRYFGRAAGFTAGLVLATTPVIVAVSRHNNPDELLVLCSVAAIWLALRAMNSTHPPRTRWLVLCGLAVGLGFETKMAVALMVVPGITLAWLWCRWSPGGGLRAQLGSIRQLLAGGLAMVVAGGAWPLLVTLVPASDRPWISGTSDNSIWSLIFNYNGLGRLAGQTGGPAGGGGAGGPGGGGGAGGLFGGNTGIFRLLQSSLGDQAGWLLGFALVSGLGLLVLTRLRRRDPRTGWLIVVGGAFLTTVVAFSFAQGIFHPYYVSLVAPFAAALVGAGVGQMLPRPFGVAQDGRTARVLAPLAIAAGVVTELVVLGTISGLSWAYPLVIGVGGGTAVLLAVSLPARLRAGLVAVGVAALLAAPATWAAETLGHATSGTFPAGGPASAQTGGPGGGTGGPGGFAGRGGSAARGGLGLAGPPGAPGGGGGAGSLPGFGGGNGFPRQFGGAGPPGAGFGGGGMFGGESTSLGAAIKYANAHGGGTIGVSSQSSAAAAILSSHANVAGLGGFSGRESSVSASWIASEVKAGRLRWVLPDGTGAGNGAGGRLPGDTRSGSQAAIAVVEQTCRAVSISTGSSAAAATGSSSASSTNTTMYDCQGRSAAILAAAARAK
jgi:4-amino-4-deoxy-L-arabinose transferase-like glycosyltransferase